MWKRATLFCAMTAILLAPLALYARLAFLPTLPSPADPDPDPMISASSLLRAADLTGLLATSALILSLLLASRLPFITRTLAHPAVLSTHRYFALLSLSLALAHLFFLYLYDSAATLNRLGLTSPHHPPLPALFGLLALLSLTLLAVTSRLTSPSRNRAHSATSRTRLARTQGIIPEFRARHPDAWRRIHLLLALVLTLTTAFHILTLQHLATSTSYRAVLLVFLALATLPFLRRWLVRPLRTLLRRDDAYTLISTAQASGILTLTLAPPDHLAIPRFQAGQFAYLRTSPLPAPFSRERPFTISSSAATPSQLEFTIRMPTRLASLAPGDIVYLDGPHGTLGAQSSPTLPAVQLTRPSRALPASSTTGATATTALPTICIVSGVGITPALSILRTLADHSDIRSHRILLAAKSKADLLQFRPQLDDLARRINLTMYFAPTYQMPPYGDTISAGDLMAALPSHPEARASFHYILCGNASFCTNIYTLLLRLNVPRAHIHTEALTPPTSPAAASLDPPTNPATNPATSPASEVATQIFQDRTPTSPTQPAVRAQRSTPS